MSRVDAPYAQWTDRVRTNATLGYLTETEPDTYRIARAEDEPTHRWGFDEDGFVVFAPLEEPPRGMRNVRSGDRLLIYGRPDAD
jgi:hypothetical protein